MKPWEETYEYCGAKEVTEAYVNGLRRLDDVRHWRGKAVVRLTVFCLRKEVPTHDRNEMSPRKRLPHFSQKLENFFKIPSFSVHRLCGYP